MASMWAETFSSTFSLKKFFLLAAAGKNETTDKNKKNEKITPIK